MLCCWLKVPGKEVCGPTNDQWNYTRVTKKIEEEKQRNATFVLPLATIIETGNHISQAPNQRYEIAKEFAELLKATAENQTPWAAFEEQASLWDERGLKNLSENWPELASQKFSIGDATITSVADYYSRMGYFVEIFTGDQQLKSYTPAVMKSAPIPRRKK